jgi:hypothetical protein
MTTDLEKLKLRVREILAITTSTSVDSNENPIWHYSGTDPLGKSTAPEVLIVLGGVLGVTDDE